MTRLSVLIVICLLLAGCTKQASDIPALSEKKPESNHRGGLYDAAGPLQEASLRAYPLKQMDCREFYLLDDDVYLLNGQEVSLTRFTGLQLQQAESIQLDESCRMSAENITIVKDGFALYFPEDRCIRILNRDLSYRKRILLPADFTGLPQISEDCAAVYYAARNSIRVLETESGVSRMIKELPDSNVTISDLRLHGSILQVQLCNNGAAEQMLLLRAETGETLYKTEDKITFTASGGSFFATCCTDGPERYYFRAEDDSIRELIPRQSSCILESFAKHQSALGCCIDPDTKACTLDLYDLTSGLITASITAQIAVPAQAVQDSSGNIWLLTTGEGSDGRTLYRWAPERSVSGNSRNYTAAVDSPDTTGLRRCQSDAAAIGRQFDVTILLGDDAAAIQPRDCTILPECRPCRIEEALDALDECLRALPASFRNALLRFFSPLHICLVADISADIQISPDAASGLGMVYSDSSGFYLLLPSGSNLPHTLAHQISHLIDTRVYGTCNLYDSWDSLNPPNFIYDRRLAGSRDVLEGENAQCFIDSYAMSYPAEDRARILEYAVQPRSSNHFTTTAMRRKLGRICAAVRQAFGLSNSTDIYPWEQYLRSDTGEKE